MHREEAAHGRWDGWLCSAVVVLAILAGKPFVECGLVDDFSYIKTAWVYAETGRFVYNGWATAMLGWQVPWGALFIKLFGYSVWPLHLSNLVLTALCVPLLHSVMVRSGLKRTQAAFAVLLTCLSPIFVPLASSFMTDVGGLLAITACWYACLRALSTGSDRNRMLWLIAGAAAGTVGGTSRQIAWIAALALVPAAGWLLRRHRGVPALTAALWMGSLLSVVAALRWFKHQLFSVPEPIIQGQFHFKDARQLACTALAGALCLAMLCVPALLAVLPSPRNWKPRAVAAVASVSIAFTGASFFITGHLVQHGWMPWTGDILERLGLLDYPGGWLLGVQPMMFSHGGRVVASFVIVGVLTAAVVALFAQRDRFSEDDAEDGLSWRTQCILLGPFVLGYLCLLLPRAIWFQVLDRYLLPLVPVVALGLLRFQQRGGARRVPGVAWGALTVFTLFAVLGTHDWLESHRARLSAIALLNRAGIPIEHINAGYEINGMTQIQQGRAIVDQRVTYPPEQHIVQETVYPAGLPVACRYTVYKSTPIVKPEYFLAYQVVPCLRESRFGAVPFRTWLPPYDRQIMILQREPMLPAAPGA